MVLKNKKVISVLGLLQILILFLSLCFTTISYKSELLVYISVLSYGIATIFYSIFFGLAQKYEKYFKQIHTINVIMGCVVLVILLRDPRNIHFPGYQKIILLLTFANLVFCEYLYLKKADLREILRKIKAVEISIKSQVELYLMLIVFGILSIHLGGTTYKWDSRLYYITCQELNAFSISDLAIYGHTAQAFGFLLKLGKVFFGDMNVAVHFVNVFVAMCGICAFYGIMRHICPKTGRINLCLATGVFAFSSYTLGLVNYLSLDYYCACLFPVVVYFMLKKQWVFHIIAAIFFVFTKEPAIIIYAGLCLGYLIIDIKQLKERYGLKVLKELFFSIKYWYMALIGILWLATYKLLGPWSAGEGGISFDFGFMWDKLKVMYLMNFGWYFSLLFLVAVLITVFKKKKNLFEIYTCLLIPLFVFTLFNCVFRTANHYRYNAITFFVICSVGMLYILELHKKYVVRIILGISCIISLCTSYLSIDPVSDSLFGKVFVGNGYIWSTSEDLRLGDSAIYNKQMLRSENALNQAFKASMTDGDQIVLQAEHNNIWYADGLTDFQPLNEDGYSYSCLWDTQLGQRVSVETEATQEIEMVQIADIEDIIRMVESNSFEKTYSYVAVSDTNNELIEQIKEYYSVLDEQEYEYGDWKYKRVRFRKIDTN